MEEQLFYKHAGISGLSWIISHNSRYITISYLQRCQFFYEYYLCALLLLMQKGHGYALSCTFDNLALCTYKKKTFFFLAVYNFDIQSQRKMIFFFKKMLLLTHLIQFSAGSIQLTSELTYDDEIKMNPVVTLGLLVSIRLSTCFGYENKLPFIVRLQFWRSREYGIFLYCHYS